MEKLIFIVFSVVAFGIVSAQEPLPSGITPLNGSVTLRYAPKFESRCTIKKSEKKPGEFFGTKTTETLTMEVFDESGHTKLAFNIPVGVNYMRMIMPLNDDRTMTGGTDIDIQSDIADVKKNKEKFGKLFLGLMKKVSGSGVFGKPLKQGSRTYMDTVFGQDIGKIGTTESAESVGSTGYDSIDKFFSGIQIKSDDFFVIGIANIRGRESLVSGGEMVFEMGTGTNSVSAKIKGWDAYDLQSGLRAGSSYMTVGSNAEKGEMTSTEDYECSITGAPNKASQAQPDNVQDTKSAEQRLIELKVLHDKGLITPEQFESKRTEILNSL